MIITVNMAEEDVMKLAAICNESKKTLITVKNKGLVGTFSIQAPEHTGKLNSINFQGTFFCFNLILFSCI